MIQVIRKIDYSVLICVCVLHFFGSQSFMAKNEFENIAEGNINQNTLAVIGNKGVTGKINDHQTGEKGLTIGPVTICIVCPVSSPMKISLAPGAVPTRSSTLAIPLLSVGSSQKNGTCGLSQTGSGLKGGWALAEYYRR